MAYHGSLGICVSAIMQTFKAVLLGFGKRKYSSVCFIVGSAPSSLDGV